VTDTGYWKAMEQAVKTPPSPLKPCSACGELMPRDVCLACENHDLRRELESAQAKLRLVNAAQIRSILATVPAGVWAILQEDVLPSSRRVVTTSVFARRHGEKPERVTYGIGTDHKKARDIAEFIAYAHMTLVTLGGRL
jgi:hypothetical protein